MATKLCTIKPFKGIQLGYGAAERQSQGKNISKGDFHRSRKIQGHILTEPDGYERFFDRKRDAVNWIIDNY